jgi:hypothetical protein
MTSRDIKVYGSWTSFLEKKHLQNLRNKVLWLDPKQIAATTPN